MHLKRPPPWQSPRALAILVVLALPACSPYGFRQPVDEFATATEGMLAAIPAGRRAVDADARALVRLDVVDGRRVPTLRGNCVRVRALGTTDGCRVVPSGDDGRYRTEFPLREDQVAKLQGLNRYARSLQALTRAEDREALNAASAKAASAIGALAATAAPVAPAATIVGPVAHFALYLVGEALDTERYLRLRRAVDEADPHLATLREPLTGALRFVQTQRVRLLSDAAQSLVAGIPAQRTPEARGQRFDQASERAQALAALVAEDPAKPVNGMIAAHAALRAALHDPQKNAEALAPAIQEFVAEVETLKAALAAASKTGE